MTLDQLAVFVAVAEREHVTRAAEALNLAQSAASAAIASLEREFGFKLFHRVGRNIALTEGGSLFFAEARAILDRADSAARAMREVSELKRGRISIKASQTIASHFLPQRLVTFHKAYPGIVLAVSVGNSAQVATAVADGTVELGLSEGPRDDLRDPHLLTELIAEDRMVVVVGAVHSWAERQAFTPAELAAEPWVVREDGSGTRAIFHQTLAKLGVAVADQRIAIELPSNEAVLTAAIEGVGPAVLSESVCADTIAAKRVKRLPVLLDARPFYAVQRGDHYRSRAVITLLGILRARG